MEQPVSIRVVGGTITGPDLALIGMAKSKLKTIPEGVTQTVYVSQPECQRIVCSAKRGIGGNQSVITIIKTIPGYTIWKTGGAITHVAFYVAPTKEYMKDANKVVMENGADPVTNITAELFIPDLPGVLCFTSDTPRHAVLFRPGEAEIDGILKPCVLARRVPLDSLRQAQTAVVSSVHADRYNGQIVEYAVDGTMGSDRQYPTLRANYISAESLLSNSLSELSYSISGWNGYDFASPIMTGESGRKPHVIGWNFLEYFTDDVRANIYESRGFSVYAMGSEVLSVPGGNWYGLWGIAGVWRRGDDIALQYVSYYYSYAIGTICRRRTEFGYSIGSAQHDAGFSEYTDCSGLSNGFSVAIATVNDYGDHITVRDGVEATAIFDGVGSAPIAYSDSLFTKARLDRLVLSDSEKESGRVGYYLVMETGSGSGGYPQTAKNVFTGEVFEINAPELNCWTNYAEDVQTDAGGVSFKIYALAM